MTGTNGMMGNKQGKESVMDDKKQETAVTMYDRINDPMDAIQKMGEWISKSGLFGCDKIEQGMILAMESYSTRRPVTDICRRYHIMDGKLSMKSEAMLAEYNQHGGRHRWEKSDDKEAVLVLNFQDFKDFKVSYTIKDAERAGLCGKDGAMRPGQSRPGGWQKNPDAMLRARVTSKGIRMVDPSVVVGVYTPEEISDSRAEITVSTPQRSLLTPQSPTIGDQTLPLAVDTPTNSEVIEAETPSPPAGYTLPVDKLTAALSGMTGDANEWLIDKKWVSAGQTFRDLPEVKMQEILSRLQNFKQAVKTWKNLQKKETANEKK
jgi:hypothetical protein